MGWYMKQIWLEEDPLREMAIEPFDYFIWEDEEPFIQTRAEDETTMTVESEAETNETNESTNETRETTDTTDETTETTEESPETIEETPEIT